MVSKLQSGWIKSTMVRILVGIILIALFLCASSYYKSKLSATVLVGETLKTYPLSHAWLTTNPFNDTQITWAFKFSLPGSYDEEFYIYTTLWGTIVVTNPIDLGKRLMELQGRSK